MSENLTNSDDTSTGLSTDPSAVKPPQEWATGDEPATGAQISYLETLAREVGEEVPGDLTKAHASELIDQYRERSPRVES
ncbi:DUF3072 domain-containing protein [Kineosporia succinea]|uniref:DUF3072 family protein n=1 Tax=Kineosporia succinea TaxID=84632 RepID=A0ABT9PDN5_9ACTN|nr:DUF3072 domain-containing protein [Kineosporia succinea]MDP9830504.1 hypothetical protein [Kineosporia succinea]